jgi:hypothetical protein
MDAVYDDFDVLGHTFLTEEDYEGADGVFYYDNTTTDSHALSNNPS